jgi:hypothetical protein
MLTMPKDGGGKKTNPKAKANKQNIQKRTSANTVLHLNKYVLTSYKVLNIADKCKGSYNFQKNYFPSLKYFFQLQFSNPLEYTTQHLVSLRD